MEDGKAVSVVQIFDSPTKQSGVPAATSASLELAKALPQDESLVAIEESAPEGVAGDPRRSDQVKKCGLSLPWRHQIELLPSYRLSTIRRHTMND